MYEVDYDLFKLKFWPKLCQKAGDRLLSLLDGIPSLSGALWLRCGAGLA